MQIIEAALAFAVTMLVLSIVCSALVETIHRTLRMRETGYRKMLGELFDHVLRSYEPSQSKEQFQTWMASLRGPLGAITSVKEQSKPTTRWEKTYETLLRRRGLSGQTTAAFMEKLGTSPAGKDIVNKVDTAARMNGQITEDDVKKAIDRTLQDVAQKFETFGQEASASFQQRARLLSIVVAIVVAFALHVDAIDLFSTLLRDSNSRGAVLANQDEALKWTKRAEGAPTSDEINTAVKRLSQAESDLRDLGVPIGWTDKRIREAQLWNPGLGVSVPTSIKLYLGLLLGGLLIGLGAPFWTDVIHNVTGVRDASRKLLTADTQSSAPVALLAGELPTPQPRTPVDAFKTAHAAKKHAS